MSASEDAQAEDGMAAISMTNKLEQFREANEYLRDSKRLNFAFEEDGYLFFRRVLDPKQVEVVKHDYMEVLQQQGVVRQDVTEIVWTGLGVNKIDETQLYAGSSTADLLASTHTIRLMEGTFGEPVYMFKSHNIRYALPNDLVHLTPPHQDYFLVRIKQSFRTLWIPLIEIDEQLGGLALGGGSHKRGLIDHVKHDTALSYIFKGRKQRGIPLESVPQPWLTTRYEPGDLLVFHNKMVHWFLPNRSDRIRFSIDNRCQPVTAPRTWQAEMPILEARRIHETAKKIPDEEGAGEALFESMMIELMKRGWEPERTKVEALMTQLSQ